MESSIIIGGHGSAFVNTIYAKNAAVIELVDEVDKYMTT